MMTEAEWLACSDPLPMLDSLRGKASRRKRRLFACACCRLIWNRLTSDTWRKAVDVAERFADGEANHEERAAAIRDAVRDTVPIGSSVTGAVTFASYRDSSHANTVGASVNAARVDRACQSVQCAILKCIYNPFRPVTFEPSWRTSTVLGLASAVYAERAFDRLPILADALEDAGCDQLDLLAHCRGDGAHVRGCWAVDLILGKS